MILCDGELDVPVGIPVVLRPLVMEIGMASGGMDGSVLRVWF